MADIATERLDWVAEDAIASVQSGAAAEGRDLSEDEQNQVGFLLKEEALMAQINGSGSHILRIALSEELQGLKEAHPEIYAVTQGLRRAAGLARFHGPVPEQR